MNIIEWMTDEGIVKNEIQAQNIIAGLRLWELYNQKDYDGIKDRVRLYRSWRPKTDKKNEVPSWQAFQLAIAGIDPSNVEPRQIGMFEEAGK
jgi:hypothetical protein